MKSDRQVRQSTRGEIGRDETSNSLLDEEGDHQKTAALTVLRRGLEVSPELRAGAAITVLMAAYCCIRIPRGFLFSFNKLSIKA